MAEQKMRKVAPQRLDPTKIGMVAEAKPKIKEVYPKLTLSFKDFPEVKDWKVDSIYNLDLEVKMVGVRKDEYSNDATFEIRKVAAEDPNEEEDDGEEDN